MNKAERVCWRCAACLAQVGSHPISAAAPSFRRQQTYPFRFVQPGETGIIHTRFDEISIRAIRSACIIFQPINMHSGTVFQSIMIFLHSSFRTSSTYIWSHFRKSNRCIAYYEIFNEVLASISKQQLGSINRNSWDSKHSSGAPYFLEYLPFIQESGGVADFDPSLSYERFIPPSGPSGPVSEAEAAYVRALVDHAEQRGRIPVLTATRSLGRVAGLQQAAAGLHAVLYRNLYQQWCSYTEQAAGGNSCFLESITTIAHLNRHDPVVRDLLRMFPVETPSATDTNTFYLFVFLHVYLYSHATAASDIVIDVNQLSNDKPYRTGIQEIFAEQSIHVDFSDSRPSTAYSLVNFPCRADMLEQIQIISDAIIGKMPSERGRTITAKIVADLIEEHERHEFYSKRLRSVLLSTQRDRDGAVHAAEETRRQITDLHGERDRFASERDDAARAVEDARQQTEAMRIERDAFDVEKHEATRAAEEAARQVDALRGERDAAIHDRNAIESDHRTLGQTLGTVSAAHARIEGERDAALAARTDAERERALAEVRYAELLKWSVAFHDSTAASSSWRLTRPLRWIGFGRPKRPPRPDFL